MSNEGSPGYYFDYIEVRRENQKGDAEHPRTRGETGLSFCYYYSIEDRGREGVSVGEG